MKIVSRKSEIVNGEWLPDMDLNHDKQIQSLLCYRYTIGQTGACGRLSASPAQSSRGSEIARGCLLTACIVLVVFLTAPAQATETNPVLKQVEMKLRTALSNTQPVPVFEYPEHTQTLRTTYLPQKFLVHGRQVTGEITTNATEQIGPSYKGFVLRVHLQPLGELNQAVTPQTLREPYWQTDLNVTAVNGTTNQIYWTLSYGSRTDKELLQKIRVALGGMGENKSQLTSPKN